MFKVGIREQSVDGITAAATLSDVGPELWLLEQPDFLEVTHPISRQLHKTSRCMFSPQTDRLVWMHFFLFVWRRMLAILW